MLCYFTSVYRTGKMTSRFFTTVMLVSLFLKSEHLLFNVVDLSWASGGWIHPPRLVKATPLLTKAGQVSGVVTLHGS